MRPSLIRKLADKGFLTAEQRDHLEPIYSRRVISVFYELRIMLYLGVMLFTTGVGVLIYKNIGELGHLALNGILLSLTAWCFHYALRTAKEYTNEKVSPPTPYYDYIVLLGCLLFISVLGYLQVQYELFNDGMGLTTLITAAFFFFAAYRFDHLGVLSLAITAFASFWSISISPQKWYSGDFLDEANLHVTALIFGACVATAALLLDRKNIKRHFTFTYLNFTSLVFLCGGLAGVLMEDMAFPFYICLVYAGSAALAYYAWKTTSFLFLLYALIFAYICTTYLLTDLLSFEPALWFMYLLASCGALVYLIIRHKTIFKRA